MKTAARVGVSMCALLGLWVSSASGAEFLLRPISASGSHTIVGNEIRLNGGNQRVFVHLMVKGWGSLGLKVYQGKLDSTGYASGISGTIIPAVAACSGPNAAGHAMCAAAFGSTLSRCSVPPGAGSNQCEAGFIDRTRSDFVFFNLDLATSAVDISSLNYRYAAILNPGDFAVDVNTTLYAGHLVLDVPAGAQGTFTIDLQQAPEVTFMVDKDNNAILPITTSPVRIAIVCQNNAGCNDNSLCTTDTCNTITGVCSNTPNYPQATQCCNPATGTLTGLSDGIQCTDDVCNVLTGQVTHPNSPALTACGSTVNLQCDRPDSCDGNGVCNPRIQPSGTSCGDSTNTECNGADTCNGAGACQSNIRVAGTSCGSSSDTACDNSDTCNGLGFCLVNNEPNGTVCSDGLFCTVGERCDNALCTGGTPRDCADLLTCTDDVCNEATNQCDSTLQGGKCLIDNVCYLPGDQNPANTCEECNPPSNSTDWSVRADGSLCNDGDACTGTGRPGIGFDICTGGNCAGAPDPECNDDCEFAVPVIVGVNLSNNNNAGLDDGEASCQPDSNNDVWFKFTASCNGVTFVSTTGSVLVLSNDTVLSIHTQCPALGGVEIACDDDSGVALQSALTFATTGGTTYWIRVAGFEDNKGDITLNIRPVDDCLIDGVCYGDGDQNPDNDCQACIPELSTTEWSARPEGSSCGDPQDSLCDSPDACDGAGLCEVNYKPDGIVCEDEAPANICTFDLCQAGVCTHPPRPAGLLCGDPSDNDCDDPDECDGGGFCDENVEGPGVACGDPSDTQCDDPDLCDGFGICLLNHAADGLTCNDLNICTGGDECANGACLGDGTLPAPIVTGLSSRHLRVEPQDGPYVIPVLLRVTSPTWPCLLDYVSFAGHLIPPEDAQGTFPSIWGAIVVTDLDIFPSSEYHVRAECGTFFSPEGVDSTWRWGDIDNDGDVDAIDVTLVVNAFKHLPGSVATVQADLYPCIPDGNIDAIDVAVSVDAFKGFPYYCSPPCHP